MSIKKIVKLSFLLIIVLVILITAISSVVLYQVKENNFHKKNIEKLVSLQENMNALSKDLLATSTLNALDNIKIEFVKDEKRFEEAKKVFTKKTNKDFVDYSIKDTYKNKEINADLKKLYYNEKNIESLFDKAYDLQEDKIMLLQKFELEYPLENNLRKQLAQIVKFSPYVKLVRIFGRVEYYSKETLYQKRDKITLKKWLDNIALIKNMPYNLRGIDKYEEIVNRLGDHVVKIKEIQGNQNILANKIIDIIKQNRQLNIEIQKDIEKISSSFLNTVYFYTLILLAFTILFITILAYAVSKNVDLSVDEIEIKVEDGLQEIKALNSELEITQKEVVFTMGAIGEQRSKETGNHVKRVAEYSKLLALHYGLSEIEAEMLKEASPMHDIGKVAIPDAVLNKPGRLNDEERKIMDTHANLGYEMLKGSNRPLLRAAAIVAREHHEKWDGSGYPQGKSAENIHIYGRITALADVFDALGSDRAYKKAWDDERIFKLFKDERAKHFDPKLIDIFFDNLDDFLAVRDSLKDKIES